MWFDAVLNRASLQTLLEDHKRPKKHKRSVFLSTPFVEVKTQSNIGDRSFLDTLGVPERAAQRRPRERGVSVAREAREAFVRHSWSRGSRGTGPCAPGLEHHGAQAAAGEQRRGGQLSYSVRDVPGAQPLRADAEGAPRAHAAVRRRRPPPAACACAPSCLAAVAVRRGRRHALGGALWVCSSNAPTARPPRPRRARRPARRHPRSQTAARATSRGAPTRCSAGAPATTRATRRPSYARRWPRPRTCARRGRVLARGRGRQRWRRERGARWQAMAARPAPAAPQRRRTRSPHLRPRLAARWHRPSSKCSLAPRAHLSNSLPSTPNPNPKGVPV
jgi:hypothetical protein